MNLGRGERLLLPLNCDEKQKIRLAATLNGKTMSAYARELLVKEAEATIKKLRKEH